MFLIATELAFEKWGKYLRTRTLSNRIGIRFLEIDRQLQCASLPALFGLLAEHRTAVIDLWECMNN